MSLLDLLGLNRILWNGAPVNPTRKDLNFQGDGVIVEDDAVNARTNVTISGSGGGGEGGAVSSVFGRVGAVVAAASDYVASLIGNDSGVAGATVREALEALAAGDADTLAAAKAYTDAEIAALQSGEGEWITAVDLNFTELASQTIANGAVSLGGVAFTAANAGNADSFAVVHGTGLVIDLGPTNVIDHTLAPRVRATIPSLIPAFDPQRTRLRVTVECAIAGSDQSYELLAFGLEKTANPAQYQVQAHRGYNQAPKSYARWVLNGGLADSTGWAVADNVLRLEWWREGEFWAASATTAEPGSSANDLALAGPFTSRAHYVQAQSGYVADQHILAAGDLTFALTAFNGNTTNSFVATFRRLRIEYLQR